MGNPGSPVPLTLSQVLRFFSGVRTTSKCHLWKGALDKGGYGKFWAGPRQWIIHRWVWIHTFGPVPPGLVIRHTCSTRNCVNPKHLRCGTQKENCADREKDGNTARGERSGSSRLTRHQVHTIRLEYSRGGVSTRALGKRYGVSHSAIQWVLRKQSWSHVG